jgi:hypothetical protein
MTVEQAETQLRVVVTIEEEVIVFCVVTLVLLYSTIFLGGICG